MPAMSIAKNLRRLRKQAKLTQPALAKATGVSQQLISQLETGKNFSTTELPALARALGVRVSDIDEDYAETAGADPGLPRVVNLVGYVAAGAQAHFGDGQGPFDEVDAPDGATDKTVAVEIRGESLGALFDQWLVFYDDVHDPPRRELIGKLCVVGLSDGRILVKKLIKGQLPKTFTLLSNVEPPIHDVYVDWAARVKTMRPR